MTVPFPSGGKNVTSVRSSRMTALASGKSPWSTRDVPANFSSSGRGREGHARHNITTTNASNRMPGTLYTGASDARAASHRAPHDLVVRRDAHLHAVVRPQGRPRAVAGERHRRPPPRVPL